MAIKFEKIRPGMTLFDIHRETAGNTTMTRIGCWEVYVVSVDAEKRCARVRWNGNPETTYYERQLRRLYAAKPPSYLKTLERERW